MNHHGQATINIVTNKATKDTYTVKVTSQAKSSGRSGFRISQVEVLNGGINVKCTDALINIEYSSTVSPVIDTAVAQIRIVNSGLDETDDDSTLQLHVTLVAVAEDGQPAHSSEHDIKSTIMGSDNSEKESNSVTFTLLDEDREYDEVSTVSSVCIIITYTC